MTDLSRTLQASLIVRTHAVLCELAAPVLAFSCDAHIDVLDDVSFACKLRVDNTDSWPCIKRVFDVRLANMPQRDGWTGNEAIVIDHRVSVSAQDHAVANLIVNVPRSYVAMFDEARGGNASRVDRWRPIANVSLTGLEPFALVTASSDVSFGTCGRAAPRLTSDAVLAGGCDIVRHDDVSLCSFV